jgi:hypothetical protein
VRLRFWLGTHQPHWLALTDVPLFVSHRTLAQRRRLPRACRSMGARLGRILRGRHLRRVPDLATVLHPGGPALRRGGQQPPVGGPVGSDRSALPVLPPVGFSGPPTEPGVRVGPAPGSPRVPFWVMPLSAASMGSGCSRPGTGTARSVRRQGRTARSLHVPSGRCRRSGGAAISSFVAGACVESTP